MITTFKKLIQKILPWYEQKIPDARMKNDQEGRPWFLKTIEYDQDTLKLEDLRNFVDTQDLNDLYAKRYLVTQVKEAKGLAAIRTEIGMLYAFNKCVVQRYKGRMHFYRDDLTQKAARTMSCVGQAGNLFQEFKKNLDS
jgi:hypothetical protein